MKLSIQNAAKIKKASIEIDGITVIAGLNNTGKSTIGKILFAVFDSLSDIHKKIQKQRIDSISQRCENLLFRIGMMEKLAVVSMSRIFETISDVVVEWIDNSYDGKNEFTKENLLAILREVLKEDASYLLEDVDDELLSAAQESIQEVLKLNGSSIVHVIVSRHFENVFKRELNSRLANRDNEANAAEISVTIQGKDIHLSFVQEECIKSSIGIPISSKAVYLPNPDIIDDITIGQELGERFVINALDFKHRSLAKLLKQPEDIENQAAETAIASTRLQAVSDLLDRIIHGKFVKGKMLEDGLEEPISYANSSSGLKTFFLLKMLIMRNALSTKDVLILDEPEIHLHPQWQIVLAQIVVLLQKQLELTVLITTHSPYFADAISLYSKKYEINKGVRFYYTGINDDYSVSVTDITSQQNLLYKKITSVIAELNTLREELEEE